jgi:hypothetical protein
VAVDLCEGEVEEVRFQRLFGSSVQANCLVLISQQSA